MAHDSHTAAGWQLDPRQALRADSDFELAGFDRGARPGFAGGRKDADRLMARRGALLSELQERLFAEGRSGGTRSVLCVVQGIDTAGKGGVARHVMSLVDPQGVQLHSFGVPTEEERSHDFLWRIRRALPTPGHIGVFDRSHYEDVLVVRVDQLVPEAEWQGRYDIINQFEKELVDAGTTVLKFALMVDKDVQAMRLMERLDRPDKRWKFSPGDLDTRAKWDDFQQAYADVFARTSTDWAPWYVVPANTKWYAHLAITEILTQTMIDLHLGWPTPPWNPAELRARLASDMDAGTLAQSLAATQANVSEAIEADWQVHRAERKALLQDAATIGHHDGTPGQDATALAAGREAAEERARALRKQAKADRRAARADLDHTVVQKEELLAGKERHGHR